MASNSSSDVRGCGPNVDSLYYNLCDLEAVWGVVLEAFAAAGVVLSLILLLSLLASIPFMTDKSRKSSVGLHACFLVFTLGLFCLTFAFIVGKDFRHLRLAEAVKLNILARQSQGPRAWTLCLGAAGLWLVEAIINTEWLIITVVRHPQAPLNATAAAGRDAATPCNIANEDFAMALIYVMTLIAAVVIASLATMAGKHKQRRCEGACVLLISLASAGIWVAWVVMYVYGNVRSGGGPSWDDPTLAIALVANGWVFLLFHTIPEVCCWGDAEENPQSYPEDLYPSRGVGYETILKEQSSQNMFMENKAFSMDEPNQGNKGSKPVSPYSGYSGQLRSSVYQPTELALISKGAVNHQTELSYNTVIPRASASPPAHNGGSSPLSLHIEMGDVENGHAHGDSVGPAQRDPPWPTPVPYPAGSRVKPDCGYAVLTGPPALSFVLVSPYTLI
ncbi:G-protein coupled receptor family C group 5 member C [Merluccius polli]|uniref:G-protein coupled receptor family C group 5 member C n=1 Tax=Merluccius polli TaxID=89951 RepID=A0AA47P232_MERPO|nr:G-protein coupled receptor family C group 5 member C [Merluccius polli]